MVTNGIDVAYELALCQSIRTVVLGGDVRTSLAIVGATAEKDLVGVHYVNKLFMGAAHRLITDGDADRDECERIAQSGLPVEKVPLT